MPLEEKHTPMMKLVKRRIYSVELNVGALGPGEKMHRSGEKRIENRDTGREISAKE